MVCILGGLEPPELWTSLVCELFNKMMREIFFYPLLAVLTIVTECKKLGAKPKKNGWKAFQDYKDSSGVEHFLCGIEG